MNKEQIVEIVYKRISAWLPIEVAEKIADEILELQTDRHYPDRVNWAGLDPVKWGGIDEQTEDS